jgi:DNA polymerase (family 10)
MPKAISKFTNNQLADIFETIAGLLEIKGEVIYKILAYRKAADSLRSISQEALELWNAGRLEDIPGVGKAIAEKINELFSTGELEFLNRLTQ